MSDQHCPTCQCHAEAPSYPTSCSLCKITYGPGGEVRTHRPGSTACLMRRYRNDPSEGVLARLPNAP